MKKSPEKNPDETEIIYNNNNQKKRAQSNNKLNWRKEQMNTVRMWTKN